MTDTPPTEAPAEALAEVPAEAPSPSAPGEAGPAVTVSTDTTETPKAEPTSFAEALAEAQRLSGETGTVTTAPETPTEPAQSPAAPAGELAPHGIAAAVADFERWLRGHLGSDGTSGITVHYADTVTPPTPPVVDMPTDPSTGAPPGVTVSQEGTGTVTPVATVAPVAEAPAEAPAEVVSFAADPEPVDPISITHG